MKILNDTDESVSSMGVQDNGELDDSIVIGRGNAIE